MSNHLLPTWIRARHILTVITLLLLNSSCTDDDEPTGNDGTPEHVTIPIEGAFSDIQVVANQPTRVVVSLFAPPALGVIEEVSIDVAGTLQHVNITEITASSIVEGLLSLASNQPIASASIRVGNNPSTVCEEGILYGPYLATTGFFSDPTPSSIGLSASTVQIINQGPVVLCVDFTSSLDATFSIDAVEADIVAGECTTPANFEGAWTGTYACGNSCGFPFNGVIALTVTQDGNTASYTDDGDATFSGTVCGNVFRFERVTAGEIERGTFTLDDATHATKRSTWRSTTPPYCTGDCTDILTRVVDR